MVQNSGAQPINLGRDTLGPGTTSNSGTTSRGRHLSNLKAFPASDLRIKLKWDGTALQRAGRDTNAARELGGLEIVDVYLGRFDHASVGRQNRRFNSIQRICSFGALMLTFSFGATTSTAPHNFALKQRGETRTRSPMENRRSRSLICFSVVTTGTGLEHGHGTNCREGSQADLSGH